MPVVASASAWLPDPGATELIVKAETVSADRGFNAAGDKAIPLASWEEKRLTVYADHGINDLFSVFGKLNLQDIQTATDDFSGLGSVEIGVKTALYRDDHSVVSASVSVDGFGEGRRADFDETGNDDPDIEARLYGGYGFTVGSKPAFIDAQIARRVRGGMDADQWRVDVTAGLTPSPKWLVLGQVYVGQTDKRQGFQARWTHGEISAVRFFDDKQTLGVQVGYRQTLSGENVPETKTITVGLWKRF
ncbi:hypothetical protein PQU92_00090 [Asticcacaulis sp. BYS171W]|uniref:Porin domain-containing protein n=1 Tax=Asticcacaulis aquaticus TaxID=2984212 RepID=A0ABT5HNL8_9CAUL|nr:hypothetical protein [Asticcacaulis aquaticus]MDC7681662.1 hypothetical protein [Asticcacaulis aquaticus]